MRRPWEMLVKDQLSHLVKLDVLIAMAALKFSVVRSL